ncbi:hypothetical protein KY290_026595 [Solanum tuberosum]|uniref:Aminotransferase-like plant mobile domain-containing protein n=1 Tax=Solanum tuberosum TaxID=4113 RepID=A0ABQ7V007_SOLTU|nr:hypothetical protein KY284_023479 [Solanum tuberosum]KAH0756325.1 hypothetical protein KY290_026595 [Solanum tuberosum]
MILNTRKCDGKFWDLVNEHPIHPRVLDVIRLSGLYGVYRSHRPVVDRSLITSLVERWRPETHTFHFKTGEATITLQDVEILYGLPVKGNPILGYEPQRTIADWQNICQRLLGFTPHTQDLKHSSLKVSALNAHLRLQPQLSDLATQDMVNEKARCYMFWMIAGLMLADTSGGLLKLMYLPMLEDITAVGSYSWGSATLACLYRFLCKASQSTQNEIAGFLPLLQYLSVYIMLDLGMGESYCPQIVAQRNTRNIFHVGLPRGPHAARWFAHFSWTNTTKHVLRVFRDALDSMTEDQFIWEPYSADLIESLPDYCRIGRDIWRARVPIFCWDVVEVHLPDRVMRQFGLVQEIPSPFPFDATHFHHDRRGRPNTNWELEHAQWLPFWNHIDQYVCNAPIIHGSLRYDDPYLIWFRRITRFVIDNPTSRPQQLQGYVPNATAYETMEFYIFRAMVRDEGSNCLTYVQEADRINVQANYRRDEVQSDHLHPPIRRRGKGGVAGRRVRAVERGRVPIEMGDEDQATQDVQAAPEHEPTNTEIVPYITPQTPQISRDPSISSHENVFGSYRPQHFENAPNFTSLPVEGNELNDSNDEVNGDETEDASQGGEPSVKKKRIIFPKLCGIGSHHLNEHGQKKKTKGNKVSVVTKKKNKG